MKSKRSYKHLMLLMVSILMFLFFTGGFTAQADGTQGTALTTISDETKYTVPQAPKKLNVLVCGRTTCGNTKLTLEAISKKDWVSDAEIGFYYVDVDNAAKETVADFSKNYSSDITFCYGRYNNLLYSLSGGGSYTLPLVAYIDADGTVRKVTKGAQSARTIYETICEILNREKPEPFYGYFYGTPRMEEARTQLAMINAFRADTTMAWYWNEDNQTKTYCNDLEPLTYDYELEKVALQRAQEIVAAFRHQRPNGESCWTAFPDEVYDAKAENLAGGQATAERDYLGLREDNEDYSGQGHRRNMLTQKCNAVGIACVEAYGRKFWVQEFGHKSEFTSANTTKIDYPEKQTRYQIELSDDLFTTGDIYYYQDMEMLVGATKSVNIDPFIQGTFYSNIYLVSTYQSGNTGILSIKDGVFTALKAGESTVTVNTRIRSDEVGTSYLKVRVNPLPLSNAKITLSKTSYTYTGRAFTPGVTVKYGTKQLRAGTDYTVRYTNNKRPGTATVTITGKGNYSGTVKKTFTIKQDPKAVGYLSSIDYTNKELKKGLKVFDKNTNGKYKITAVTKKSGKVTGGTVAYMAPYTSKKSLTVAAAVTLGGVKFKITAIAANAFSKNTTVQALTIGTYVKTIGTKAMYYCKNLKTVTIKATGLTKIYAGAFTGIKAKGTFLVPKSKLKKYTTMIQKAGAPKTAKIKAK